MKANWVAVDWGTTNFRAFLMSASGHCIDKVQAQRGLLAVEQGQYPAVFHSLTAHWEQSHGKLPVIMAGMVGSQQGWLEVPYVSTPASMRDLADNVRRVELLSGDKAVIVPGVSCKNSFGNFEVMRGEEVQLLGLSEILRSDFDAVLYGTHSKHAHWRNGALHSYSTVMTGELYSLLTQHSILGKSLPEQHFDSEAFIQGVELGHRCPLNHVLFSARSNKLFGKIADQSVSCYLSGILIGHEFSAINRSDKLYLIGSKRLGENYAKALDYLNIEFEIINGDDCFLKGMTKIYNQEINNER